MKRTAGFDPDFGTATQAITALRRGAISSRELTPHVFARIKKLNPALNCFVTLTEDQAMARAAEADAALAKKKPCGRRWTRARVDMMPGHIRSLVEEG